jgi:hypothetical protein
VATFSSSCSLFPAAFNIARRSPRRALMTGLPALPPCVLL